MGKVQGEDMAELLLEEGLVCVEPISPRLIRQSPHTKVQTYLKAQARTKTNGRISGATVISALRTANCNDCSHLFFSCLPAQSG
ncbi:hypothetical protein D915_011185 [Fasciola hepatica]|uniref:Uncharacterized protein n=1 Tax=Fasciola hepatica TaxID=6192 RepID=A0A4E0QYM2_FASHE|nr:hypothetical protein D915_011185 [Fasciola hepatica]